MKDYEPVPARSPQEDAALAMPKRNGPGPRKRKAAEVPSQTPPEQPRPEQPPQEQPRPSGSAHPSYGSYGSYGPYGAYQGYAEYGPATGTAASQVMHYVRTIYKQRWVALTAFSVLFLGMAIRTFSATPIYQGRVQLLIEPLTPNVVTFKEVIEQHDNNYDYYPTQYAILRSRSLARRTIDELKLWDHPEFGGGGGSQARTFSVSGALFGGLRHVAGWVTGLFADEPGAPTPAGSGETARQSGIIDAFLARLTVAPVKNSRLVDVGFASTSPQVAAAVANSLARQYIEQNLEYRFMSTKEASDWLGDQLAQEKTKLAASEQALQRYREKGDAVALEDRQNIVVQRLADLNAAYTKARTDRFEKEALYNQLKSLQHDRTALDTFPAILANAFIQQLKSQLADLQRQQAQMAERLGEKHPEMIKQRTALESTETKLDAEIAKVVQSVRNEFLSAQAQERSLASALESQKADALSLNRRGIEYGVLRREAESNKQIYEALMQRAKETGISGELKTSNIRIVDQAEVPKRPVSPNTSRDLLVGFLGGLIAGVGASLFVASLDANVKDPGEIKQFLGLGFLGLVPALTDKELPAGSAPLLSEPVPQNFAEAFRGIRTNLMFSSADEGPRVVVITSTQPVEGKSVVAANLAISLAQTGQRVILIDADMRKPRQQDLFKLPPGPGLSSLLVGKSNADESVRPSAFANLWLMTSGPNPPNPAELLGSARFRELLTGMRQLHDWVVIDSPPVMAVTDASVIGHLATGVVFVIGCERVNRHAARTAVEQLLAARATILGAVLNRVNVRKNPYYYAHYYRHEYAEYYTSGTSPQPAGPAAGPPMPGEPAVVLPTGAASREG
jgi:succinoglycan biosynthesis transport protein ExoP